MINYELYSKNYLSFSISLTGESASNYIPVIKPTIIRIIETSKTDQAISISVDSFLK